MDLVSKLKVKNLLKNYQIRPVKKLGQNFLIDRKVVKKIIEASNLQPDDVILEIGPGLGALTQELTKKVKRIVAIEKDQNLVGILNKNLRINNIKNIKIIQGDVLKLSSSKFLISNSYKVVGNLPFYLTAPVIRKFLEKVKIKPLEMVFLVQKEVAQRICAKPQKMNLLAISVQFYGKPEIVSYLSKSSFWPQPKVDAAILRIRPFLKSEKKQVDVNLFFKIVKAGFSQPRKQILNNLSKMLKLNKEEVKLWLLKNKIQLRQRAQNLTIQDWLKLTYTFPF